MLFRSGAPLYDCRVIGGDGRRTVRSGALTVAAEPDLSFLERAHTVVIPGWREDDAAPPRRLLAALRTAHANDARFLSICTGAFLLGYAGLLDGRRATTHWRHADRLATAFPETTVEADVLYVADGPILTSAGSAAGIDAGLHMIRLDHGEIGRAHV